MEGKWSRGVRAVAMAGRMTSISVPGWPLPPDAAGSAAFLQGRRPVFRRYSRLAVDPKGQLWIGAMGGIDVYSDHVYRRHYGPQEGLPNPTCARWLSTAPGRCGRARPWEWRGSMAEPGRYATASRWLMSDDVRDIAFGKDGTAWIATSAGVSAIKRGTMTLEEKAAYYLDICYKRHIREPFIVEKCLFPDPKDTSKWQVPDDDNDGTFTAMYMAMESFRWAVTKDPVAKAHATRPAKPRVPSARDRRRGVLRA